MSNLKPGDMCIVKGVISGNPEAMAFEGKIVTLVRFIGDAPYYPNNIWRNYWEIEEQRWGQPVYVDESVLHKLPPDRDDLRIVEWDDCPWQPEEVILKHLM